MKKTLLFLAVVIAATTMSAQDNALSNLPSLNILKSRHDFYQQRMQRVPHKADFTHSTASLATDNAQGREGYKNSQASSLPENRWFPGEWEEVQAIVVTWNYNAYPADHPGDDNYTASPLIPGYGQLYKYNAAGNLIAYNGGWGPIVGVPDTNNYNALIEEIEQFIQQYPSQASQYNEYLDYYKMLRDFRDVFVNLIDGIQHQAQVWINIWQYGDSTIIKNYMAAIGKPLTNYRFIQSYGDAFWYRDCGPICFYYGSEDSVAMLDFEYYPGRALDDMLPDSIASQTGIPNYHTSIEWEGGNCLVDGAGMVLSSDAIYGNNTDRTGQMTWEGTNYNSIRYTTKAALTKAQVKDSLQYLLGPRATYILPALKYDGGTGHVDLYADMWDENEFIFSKYPDHYSSWTDYRTANKNIDTLTSHTSLFGENYKSTFIPFPSTDNGGFFSNQTVYNEQYTRSYSNHTFVNKMIIQPCFSTVENGEPTAEWDKNNLDSLRAAYPVYTFFPIDIRSFDGFGGAIHCITKQIPADNPIRILHKSATRHNGILQGKNKNIEATITNRSGIASATCYWRANGGEWKAVAMGTGDADNKWGGMMNFADANLVNGDTATIEYYISATSNKGKTITKPMTAEQGGYYTFDVIFDNNVIGIEPVADQFFGQFYPNPCHNKASIAIATEGDYTVSVIDMMGRTVENGILHNAGTYTIDTQKLSRGIYNVVFTATNGKHVVRRIVVQ